MPLAVRTSVSSHSSLEYASLMNYIYFHSLPYHMILSAEDASLWGACPFSEVKLRQYVSATSYMQGPLSQLMALRLVKESCAALLKAGLLQSFIFI